MKDRPLGVSIIAIVLGIEAILQILASLAMFGLAIAGVFTVVYSGPATIAIVMGILFLIIGIIELAVTMGLWNLEGWAWTVAVVVTWIDVIFDVIGGFVGTQTFGATMLSLAIPLIVLIYLYQSGVRQAFNK
jgi:uncharacterized membrane protein (DUF2068 family)